MLLPMPAERHPLGSALGADRAQDPTLRPALHAATAARHQRRRARRQVPETDDPAPNPALGVQGYKGYAITRLHDLGYAGRDL